MDVASGKVKVGKRVVVIGGGKIGLTLAESLKRQGAEVTVVEREKRIGGDLTPAFKWRHSQWVETLKIATLTSSRVGKITAEGVRYLAKNKARRPLSKPIPS
jgi:2,4-dienoyl-CoA reductase (NADPH2)